jgi:hypothetical protein
MIMIFVLKNSKSQHCIGIFWCMSTKTCSQSFMAVMPVSYIAVVIAVSYLNTVF